MKWENLAKFVFSTDTEFRDAFQRDRYEWQWANDW